MKASEVIKKLQDLVTEHGDCEVNALKWDDNTEVFLEFPFLLEIFHADGDGEEYIYLQYGKSLLDVMDEELRND